MLLWFCNNLWAAIEVRPCAPWSCEQLGVWWRTGGRRPASPPPTPASPPPTPALAWGRLRDHMYHAILRCAMLWWGVRSHSHISPKFCRWLIIECLLIITYSIRFMHFLSNFVYLTHLKIQVKADLTGNLLFTFCTHSICHFSSGTLEQC